MVISRTLHIRESLHAALRPSINSAGCAHAYNGQERNVRRDAREARRSGRNPQRTQRPSQFRECVRRVLCVHWEGSIGTEKCGRTPLTARAAAQVSSFAAIWACSCGLTAPGGVCRSRSVSPSDDDDDDDGGSGTLLSTKQPPRSGMARLMTAHQIGTVFESASGRRLPARVESTRISLESKEKSEEGKVRRSWRRTRRGRLQRIVDGYSGGGG